MCSGLGFTAHAALVTQGRAGTFNDVVDGAGCKLVGMDYRHMIATGWPVAQLPKSTGTIHSSPSRVSHVCFLSRDVSQTSTHQCGLKVYCKKSVCVFRDKKKCGLGSLASIINLKCLMHSRSENHVSFTLTLPLKLVTKQHERAEFSSLQNS